MRRRGAPPRPRGPRSQPRPRPKTKAERVGAESEAPANNAVTSREEKGTSRAGLLDKHLTRRAPRSTRSTRAKREREEDGVARTPTLCRIRQLPSTIYRVTNCAETQRHGANVLNSHCSKTHPFGECGTLLTPSPLFVVCLRITGSYHCKTGLAVRRFSSV